MKTSTHLLGLLAGLVVCQSALAQGVDELGAYGGLEEKDRLRSEQNFAFELRFGPYRPNVDAEFSDARPFENTFGTDTRILFGIEFDWQALRIPYFGSIGPGIGWGYTSMSANAWLADGTGRADQETSLSIMPLYLVGVARVDVLARETPVPLVPYAKAGLGYALWWTSDGDGAHSYQGVEGKGTSKGYQFALGGMLELDFLDQDTALNMDASIGVNHASFFMEWYFARLDGFGGGDMHVGTSTWMLGLVVEM